MFLLQRSFDPVYRSVLRSEKRSIRDRVYLPSAQMYFTRNMSVVKKPILYGDESSPPVRFAMMTAKLLNIEFDFHFIDLFKEENRSQFYKKINPLQKVPALSVNGDIICDSHAIALYFCRSSNSEDLYPQDAMLRAKIDELLYFHAGVLFPIDSAIFTDFFAGKKSPDDILLNNWYSALDHLELKLTKQKWLTGDKMQLCDICCGTTISSLGILVPLLERHGNVRGWLRNLELLPSSNINTRGLQRLQGFVEIIKQQS